MCCKLTIIQTGYGQIATDIFSNPGNFMLSLNAYINKKLIISAFQRYMICMNMLFKLKITGQIHPPAFTQNAAFTQMP